MVTEQQSRIRRAAVAYAEQGLRVFPLRFAAMQEGGKVKYSKRPVLPAPSKGGPRNPEPAEWQNADLGGFHQGCNKPAYVSGWFMAYPADGIGLAINPRTVVIDIDGPPCIARLEAEYPMLSEAIRRSTTYVVETPGSRGLHYYFRVPKGIHIGQTQGGTGVRSIVDIRSMGRGLTALPPSKHAGGEYKTKQGRIDNLAHMHPGWVNALLESSGGEPAKRAPKRPRKPRAVSLRPSSYNAPGEIVAPYPPEGGKWPAGTGRTPILNPLAGRMHAAGWPKALADMLILEWNRECFAEPKNERELLRVTTDTLYAKGG